ncbi:hypothetical protein ABIB73_004729 [Bradyrhizobium sp. F1.4.3]
MPECHAGAKWGDLSPINTLFMLRRAKMKELLRLNRFRASPTYYGGNRM